MLVVHHLGEKFICGEVMDNEDSSSSVKDHLYVHGVVISLINSDKNLMNVSFILWKEGPFKTIKGTKDRNCF